ncbi:MAG: farnesyl diphosphate synthase [Gammaproteobacteria bacterium]
MKEKLERYQVRIEQVLERCLSLPDSGTDRLRDGMRYSVLGGGKRLRPILVYTTGEALGAPLEHLDVPAAAVELVHVYSLVHDDLPAMDDDDLRRGRPTCHRAYDEATAILVGDALQALAFDVLAHDDSGAVNAAARLEMIRILAYASGTSGMAGGQAIDLASVGHSLTAEGVENMHRRKTGALIQCSVMLGATAAGLTDPTKLDALRRFGANIGLAFQIQDDILDIEGETSVIGKSAGADIARNKPTYPSTIGLHAARARAQELCDGAIAALAPLGQRATALAELARFVVNRSQ